jgi:hypothetical protein
MKKYFNYLIGLFTIFMLVFCITMKSEAGGEYYIRYRICAQHGLTSKWEKDKEQMEIGAQFWFFGTKTLATKKITYKSGNHTEKCTSGKILVSEKPTKYQVKLWENDCSGGKDSNYDTGRWCTNKDDLIWEKWWHYSGTYKTHPDYSIKVYEMKYSSSTSAPKFLNLNSGNLCSSAFNAPLDDYGPGDTPPKYLYFFPGGRGTWVTVCVSTWPYKY